MTDLEGRSSLLTASARRRTWAEWPLRTWLAGAIALFAVAAGLAVRRGLETAHERSILLGGVPVEATVTYLDGVGRGQRVKRDHAIGARMEYTKPEFTQNSRPDFVLPPSPGETVAIGDKLPLMTDPANGYVWRLIAPPPGYARALMPTAIVAGVALVPMLMAAFKRRAILTILRDGRSVLAHVLAVRSAALAPKSRLLKVQLDDGPTELLWPTRLGPVAPDSTIDVLRHPRRTLAVAEAAYRNPTTS